ncbi:MULTISPECIES: hypothetical protein [unclassified Chelatococcus]|uniref:deoxynucleotide monophosphate kinase family protein n=1 Tax=unclassified Chelatococcus TaxID=2638111 RepID=UPI001BD1AB02|nr:MULTISPECIES: hypothetical protein [unclassified Chelatococcus]MBS7738493.1 hypothetical protein [Chelatococcus sp. HY11]MBX3542897.1 hypothetical protein [Chelatococcus sp.]
MAPHIGRPLKQMLAALLREIGYDEATIVRFVDGDLKRDLIPELGITSTEAQQTLGTEWGRQCVADDFWLSLWLAKVDRVIRAGGHVVQESVRFANEVAALRQRGAFLVEVQRPGVGPLSDHPSEVLPGEPDLVFQNDGTLNELRLRAANLAGKVRALEDKNKKGTDFGTFSGLSVPKPQY